MNYRYLGRTGLKVSELCLGAMTFGREATEEVSLHMLNRFVEAGGNFIDTADVYTRGVSEEILGRWLKGRRRDDFVIATKVRFPTGERAPSDTNQRVGISRLALGASRATGPIRLKAPGAAWLVNMWSRSGPNQAACVGTPGTWRTAADLRMCWSQRCAFLPIQGGGQGWSPAAPRRGALVKAAIRGLGCVRRTPSPRRQRWSLRGRVRSSAGRV